MERSLYVPYTMDSLKDAIVAVLPEAPEMLGARIGIPSILDTAAKKLFLAGDVTSPHAMTIRSAMHDLSTAGRFLPTPEAA